MPLTIGQVAKRSGIGLETVRFMSEKDSSRNGREQIRVTGSTRRTWLLAVRIRAAVRTAAERLADRRPASQSLSRCPATLEGTDHRADSAAVLWDRVRRVSTNGGSARSGPDGPRIRDRTSGVFARAGHAGPDPGRPARVCRGRPRRYARRSGDAVNCGKGDFQ